MDQFEFENKKKRKLRKEPIYVFICIICLVVGGCVGFYFASPKQEKVQTNEVIYNQIAEIVEKNFLDTTDSEYSLQERMLNGMIAALGDKYSAYMTTDQVDSLTDSINGSFEGIGVSFTTIPLGGLILETFDGAPAQQAGVLAGDVITHVQGTSVEGYDSDKIKEMILGEKGSELSIQVLRNGKEKTFHLKRGSVESSVGYEIRTENQKKVGYLRITTFGNTTASLVEEALKKFENENVKYICIDLRGNGGGYITAVNGLLDFFIPKGELMFKIQYANQQTLEYKASDIKKYSFDQGFILTNGETASASEVMTSALSELLGYKVIGEKTYGKGVVQSQELLSNSSTLKLTTGKWLTPKGNWVNGKGIQPDYKVKKIYIQDYEIYNEMKETYQYDQVNEQIKNMQEILKLLGYSVDRTDGYFSLKTKESLKKFEKDYGLKQDGLFDKNDYAVLISALSYYVYQKAPDNQYQKMVELLK